MADPLLTSLCAICHAARPKYKCPRCHTHTCSLACVRKHKAWRDCNGIRDATAYTPNVSTRAAVDHDYNFLSAIERSKRQAEHDIVNNKGIVAGDELRPLTVQQVEWRWRNGTRKRVLVTRAVKHYGDGDHEDDEADEELLQKRLRRFNTNLVRAPVGMSLRRHHGVRCSNNNGDLLWPVEWVLVSAGHDQGWGGKESSAGVWSKVSDQTSVGMAFLRCSRAKFFAAVGPAPTPWQRQYFSVQAWGMPQDPSTTAWTQMPPPPFQHDSTGVWVAQDSSGLPFLLTQKQHEWLRDRVRFYLSQQLPTSTSLAHVLVPLDPADSLRETLRGKVVFEHPTIYVLWKSTPLPADVVVRGSSSQASRKRRRPAEYGRNRTGRAAKRRKVDGREEGEIPSEAEEATEEEARGAEGHRADDSSSEGDIVAEMSLSDSDSDSNGDSDTCVSDVEWEEDGHVLRSKETILEAESNCV